VVWRFEIALESIGTVIRNVSSVCTIYIERTGLVVNEMEHPRSGEERPDPGVRKRVQEEIEKTVMGTNNNSAGVDETSARPETRAG